MTYKVNNHFIPFAWLSIRTLATCMALFLKNKTKKQTSPSLFLRLFCKTGERGREIVY